MRAATVFALVIGVVLLGGSIGMAARDESAARSAADEALSRTATAETRQLQEYFARARTINLITAHNPAFRAVVGGPSGRDVVRRHGSSIRAAEDALAYLEQLYPSSIGEACFIVRSGPEDARVVRGVRAPFSELSPDEHGNPFFAPTFALRAGQVYQAKPYVSPDTREWVISNATPVPRTGFPAAGIVHFEVTIASFQRAAAALARQSDIAVVDAASGLVVFDSRYAQRRGAPLGRPADHRFVGLASGRRASGAVTLAGHRVAFRRLERSAHNANDWLVAAVDPDPAPALLGSAGWASAGMAGGGLTLLLLSLFTLRGARRAEQDAEDARAAEESRTARERRYHETQREFTEIMQITRDEDEAYSLLKHHLERSLEGSEVLVLNRNNSHDRLEPMTAVPEGSPLAEPLRSATPESCLAIRMAKAHERAPASHPLLTCELCGGAPASTTCVPSLVGGEVIGALLVQHVEPLGETSRRRIEESMTQASPVLANLRNLALSEARALTDGLTGLPNRRAVDDTLKRMAAHAGRTDSPLGAILFDLDHFKQVNDLCGHEKGDEVLAAVGLVVAGSLRASDFAGRYGGEEFVLLLPDTDRAGAVTAAEKLRRLIAEVDVPGVSRPISASLGVAALPEDAAEPALLLRAADRALYLAKANGRNRVETYAAVSGEPSATGVGS